MNLNALSPNYQNLIDKARQDLKRIENKGVSKAETLEDLRDTTGKSFKTEDLEKLMEKYDPEAYAQYSKMAKGADGARTQGGLRYLSRWIDGVKRGLKDGTVSSAGTSDYLAALQKKNPKLNILTGYSNGAAGSSNYPKKINVTIAPEFLAKMESDPKLAAEYEKNLADIPTACKWGESMIRAMTGNTVHEFRFYIDENGNMSAGSISGPSRKREMFEHSRQKAKQQKEDFDKRIKASVEKKEKAEKSKEKKEDQTIRNKAKQLLEEKTAASKNGAIYLNDTDMKTIMEAIREDCADKANPEDRALAGANMDLKA